MDQPQRFGKPASEIRRPLVAQLGQFEKNRQKLDWEKNRENDPLQLCLQHFDKF